MKATNASDSPMWHFVDRPSSRVDPQLTRNQRYRYARPGVPTRMKKPGRPRPDLRPSFSDDLDQHSFLSAAIKFSIEDLLPWTEIQLAVGNGNDDFASHDLAFDVGIRIVFARIVVPVLIDGLVRHQSLEEIVVVLEQPGLIVVDVDARTDM